jgi:parvulin-like peptidyl-prolyl isomerase
MIIRPTLPRLALAAALALSSFLAPLRAGAQAKTNVLDSLFPDPVIAKGKGFEIKRSVLDDAFVTYQTEMARQKQYVPTAARNQVESNILEHLIVNKIENQKATDEEKKKVRDMVTTEVEKYRKSAPSEQAFQDELKATGSTMDQLLERGMEEQLGKTVLIRELVSSNAISDEAIKKFYDDNPKHWVLPERVKIAQILISTIDPASKQTLPPAQKAAKLKLAKDVLAQATNNGDFALLAAKYSDDGSTKDTGGLYPPFPRGGIAPAFEPIEAAAFTLRTNQISDLVETKLGYHIIKLLQKIPSSIVDLPTASGIIKETLTDDELNKQLPAYVPKIVAEYEVQTADLASATPVLAPMVIPPPPPAPPPTVPNPAQK